MKLAEAVTKVLESCDAYASYLDDALKHTPYSKAGTKIEEIREATNIVESYFVNETEIFDITEADFRAFKLDR